MNDTNTGWPAPTALLRTPMTIVRQELAEGKSRNRKPLEIAGRLLAADIGVSKREDHVEIGWLTREQTGSHMAIRLRRTPSGATIEARGAQYGYRQPPHVEIAPQFRTPDNEHATLAASMAALFDIANDEAWTATPLDDHDLEERVKLAEHTRAMRRSLANWLSLHPESGMRDAGDRESALGDLQRRLGIVRAQARAQLDPDEGCRPRTIDIEVRMPDTPGFQRQIDGGITTWKGGARAGIRWNAKSIERVTNEVWADEPMQMCMACARAVDPTDCGIDEWSEVLRAVGTHTAWHALVESGTGDAAIETAIQRLNYAEQGWRTLEG